LRTCTIITGDPNELVGQIHTRMPVILPEEDHAKWLGEVEDGDLKGLLNPFPADQMRIWAISPRVNSLENNDPGIIILRPGDMSDWKRPDRSAIVKLRLMNNRLLKTFL
jgi:putative SOS response-associated peptidase YedK